MSFMKSMGKALSATVTSKFLEKPKHEITEQTEAYECRHYEESVWVSTRITTTEGMSRASSAGFGKLFGYIMGTNDADKKIEMTAPVIVLIQPTQNQSTESETFTVSFYVGKQHWGKEPAPKDKDVFIHTMAPMDVYARVYGGFSNDEKTESEVTALVEALKKDNRTDFDRSTYYFAGYDPPFKPFGRQNEVWLVRTKAEEKTEGKSTEI